MSFDLVAWDALQRPPTTLEEADQRDEELSELFTLSLSPTGEERVPSEKMKNLANQFELLIRGMSAGEEERVWSAKPAVGRDFAVMTFSSPAADEALRITRRLCPELNVVCYDPQNHKLYRPGGGGEADSGDAALSDGTVVCRPTDAVLDNLVRSISPDAWFVTLDLGSRYIQVGLGEKAGVPDGILSLECKESDTAEIRQIQVVDLSICSAAFVAFRRNDPAWRTYFTSAGN